MSEQLPFQSPKTAVIRLVRSQGCCQSGNTKVNSNSNSAEISHLLKYKQELEMQVKQQRKRLQQFNCVITLAEQIQQLKELIEGLGMENHERVEHMKHIQSEVIQTTEYWQQNQSGEQIEHEKLQGEYQNLLKTLQMTNETNRRLVHRLIHY